jgi:hypothetical protein
VDVVMIDSDAETSGTEEVVRDANKHRVGEHSKRSPSLGSNDSLFTSASQKPEKEVLSPPLFFSDPEDYKPVSQAEPGLPDNHTFCNPFETDPDALPANPSVSDLDALGL